jgi:hypothetical protein
MTTSYLRVVEVVSPDVRIPLLERGSPTFRLRPGERPVWIEDAVSEGLTEPARRLSRAAGLGVDAWVALLVEQHLVEMRLEAVGMAPAALGRAAAQGGARVPPTDELRAWWRHLSGGGNTSRRADDDLPSVVIPARIAAQLNATCTVENIIKMANIPTTRKAISWEIAATCAGLSMETWCAWQAASLATVRR